MSDITLAIQISASEAVTTVNNLAAALERLKQPGVDALNAAKSVGAALKEMGAVNTAGLDAAKTQTEAAKQALLQERTAAQQALTALRTLQAERLKASAGTWPVGCYSASDSPTSSPEW